MGRWRGEERGIGRGGGKKENRKVKKFLHREGKVGILTVVPLRRRGAERGRNG